MQPVKSIYISKFSAFLQFHHQVSSNSVGSLATSHKSVSTSFNQVSPFKLKFFLKGLFFVNMIMFEFIDLKLEPRNLEKS